MKKLFFICPLCYTNQKSNLILTKDYNENDFMYLCIY